MFQPNKWCAAAVVAAAVLLPSPVSAQLPAARLDWVYPTGAKTGSSVEVTIAGRDLDGATGLHFSHSGITAKQKVREPGPFEEGPQPVPDTFVVSVANNVPVDRYEVRAVGKYGVSSPRAFAVDTLTEVQEESAGSDRQSAQEVSLGSAVNGRLGEPADMDWYGFAAKRGQRVILDCWAQRLDSRLDATISLFDSLGRELATSRYGDRLDPLVDFTVPADGMYYFRIGDVQFRGGADFAYRVRLGVLPVIDFVLPPAGTPGRREPFVIYGRNLPGGKDAGLSVDGRPLQQMTATIAVPAAAADGLVLGSLVEPEATALDGFEYRVMAAAVASNPVLIGAATAPLVREQEPNDTSEQAQKVEPPCEIVGQFYPRGDRDWYEFEAKAGQSYTIEVISHRLGLRTDPSLVVQQVTWAPSENEEGNDQQEEEGEPQLERRINTLATVDDSDAVLGGPGFDCRHNDPVHRFTAPADGVYRVLVQDSQSGLRSDPRNVYRLSIRSEQPDFRLAAIPSSDAEGLLLRRGGRASIRVVAFRRDGFDGNISVTAANLPEGVTCHDAIIGAGRSSATLVLTAAANAKDAVGTIQVVGKATIGGTEVARQARGGTAIFPLRRPAQNQPPLAGPARMTRNIAVAVTGGEAAPFSVVGGEAGTVYEVSRAGKVKIPYSLTRNEAFKGKVDLRTSDLPPNVDAKTIEVSPSATTGQFELDMKPDTPPGTYTFVLTGTSQLSYRRNPEAAERAAAHKEKIDAIAAELAEAAKAAEGAKAEAVKAAGAAEAAAKEAEALLAEAKKQAEAAVEAVKAATETQAAAEKRAAMAAAEAKAADEDDKEAAQKLAEEAAKAEAALVAANKALADAQAKAKEAAEAATAAEKADADAEAALAEAKKSQEAAEKAAEEAATQAQLAAEAKAASDKMAKDTADAAAAKDVNVAFVSTPIVLKVLPAPLTLSAAQPKAAVKQGETVEVAATIARLLGYDEAVTLSLAVPQGVGGVQAANVTVAKGETKGTLTIAAAANAAPQTYQLTVRATARVNNQNVATGVPFELTIEPAPPQEAED